MFILKSPYEPKGDQPKAIEALCRGLDEGRGKQVLLGITGSGKTFTMANVIAHYKVPTLILAHNKTLAAQLYQEFKEFFPDDAVEYFVSYYDYYQPEAYIARTDTYIEKDLKINDDIDRMRLSATRSLIERDNVIIVSSVSCIYGLGLPEYYRAMQMHLQVGDTVRRDEILIHLVQMQYNRGDYDLSRGSFRSRGDVIEVMPAYEEKRAFRIELFGDEIERMSVIDPLTGVALERVKEITIFPGSHHVTPEAVRLRAIETIQMDFEERLTFFKKEGRFVEEQRLRERTLYDIEMIKQTGFCKGIENYSRHFSPRNPGDPPPCLLDYFPKNYLLFVDESHQTLPQVKAMYRGDRARKEALVEFGFRLPSAYDNRPLQFEEFYQKLTHVIYVSATPAPFEIQDASHAVIEQIIRPTGLLDPPIIMKPANHQVDDALEQIRQETEKGGKVLVTTLTKKLSEDLSSYLTDIGVKAKYMHSDIDTLERVQIIHDLRKGAFDVLVGINLLREGLDIPEVSLVLILDADKEGFLRSETALIQTCGRAARNVSGRVIMYADKETKAIQSTREITTRRREMQQKYNELHGIIPTSTARKQTDLLSALVEEQEKEGEKKRGKDFDGHLTLEEIEKKIIEAEKQMRQAAKEHRFEEAAMWRDRLKQYRQAELS